MAKIDVEDRTKPATNAETDQISSSEARKIFMEEAIRLLDIKTEIPEEKLKLFQYFISDIIDGARDAGFMMALDIVQDGLKAAKMSSDVSKATIARLESMTHLEAAMAGGQQVIDNMAAALGLIRDMWMAR